MNTIEEDIDLMLKYLSGDAIKDLKKAAKKYNVSQRTLIWILTDVYPNGHMRSNSFLDIPHYVIDEGIVVEKEGTSLRYIPWIFTGKGEEIINKTKE